ncbi:MAG: PQQ-binding-like beta-propeller repeat protein [bacterium]
MTYRIPTIFLLFLIQISCSTGGSPEQSDMDSIDSDTESTDTDYQDTVVVYSVGTLDNTLQLKHMDDTVFFSGSFQDTPAGNDDYTAIGALDRHLLPQWEMSLYTRDISAFTPAGDGTLFASGNNKHTGHPFLFHIGSDGNLLFDRPLKTSPLSDTTIYAMTTHDNRVYTAGFTAGVDTLDDPDEAEVLFPRLYLAGHTSDGALLWQKYWGDRGGEQINSMTTDSIGNLYLTGYTVGGLGDNENAGEPDDCAGIPFGPEGTSCPDPYLIKTDSKGTVLWTRQWGSAIPVIFDWGRRVLTDAEDSIYVLYATPSVSEGNEVITMTVSVRKYDSDGTLVWKMQWDMTGDPFVKEFGGDMIIDRYGTLIVAGKEVQTYAAGIEDSIYTPLLLAVDTDTGNVIDIKRWNTAYDHIGFDGITETDAGFVLMGNLLHNTPYASEDKSIVLTTAGYFYREDDTGYTEETVDFTTQERCGDRSCGFFWGEDCGSCADTEYCSADQQCVSESSRPAACKEYECGDVSVKIFGRFRTVSCGSCAEQELCIDTQCRDDVYQQQWSYQTDGEIRSSPAIGPDGTVYIGSYDTYLHAVAPDGSGRWKFKTGDSIYATPAVSPDGTIYIPSRDGNLYAVAPDGTEIWRYETGDRLSSSPAVRPDGSVIYAGTDSGLLAVTKSGEKHWEFETKDAVDSSPVIDSNNTVYVGDDSGTIYAVTADGKEQWQFATKSSIDASPAIGADGTLYTLSSDGLFYAFHPDGTLWWKKFVGALSGQNMTSSPVISSDGTIFTVGNDTKKKPHNIYAFSVDGHLLWSDKHGEPFVKASAALGASGTLFLPGLYGVHIRDSNNGDETTEIPVGENNFSSPALSQNGILYIGSGDGFLYAIDTESKGVADSPWPVFRGNVRRTGHTAQ